MRVAITGGAGFIGSFVNTALTARGHEVVIIDRSHGIDLLETPDKVEDVLEYADAVIHLAGVLGTSELFDAPNHAIDVNVKGTAVILQACARYDLRYVGITMPDVWDNVYQVTKKAAKGLATAWHRNFDIPVSHVRAYNVFGPGQKVGSPQKIIPTFSTNAHQNLPIPVWGDGQQTVDLVFVADVARMFSDVLIRGGDDEVFDAGTGEPHRVIDVAEKVWKAADTGGPFKVTHLPMRRGENEHTEVVAPGEGWHLLDWHPTYLESDLYRTVESYTVKV